MDRQQPAIDDKLMDYIAEQVKLEFGPEEREARKHDLSQTLSYLEKLKELDTDGLPEIVHPFDSANRFRADEVTNEARAEQLLANAPDSKGTYFRVPRTVEE